MPGRGVRITSDSGGWLPLANASSVPAARSKFPSHGLVDALGDDEVGHGVVDVADVADGRGHGALLGRRPARQSRVAERIHVVAGLVDVVEELAAVDDVDRRDRLLRDAVGGRRRQDLVGRQWILPAQRVDEGADGQRTVVVEVALELVAEQGTDRLAFAHPFEHRQRVPDPARREVDRHRAAVGDVGVAQHGSGGGVVDRRGVHEPEVGGVLDERDGGPLVDIRGEVGIERHRREGLVLGAEILNPAIGAEMRPRLPDRDQRSARDQLPPMLWQRAARAADRAPS